MLSEEQKDFIYISYQSEEHYKEIDEQGSHQNRHLCNVPFRPNNIGYSRHNNTNNATNQAIASYPLKPFKARIFTKKQSQIKNREIVKKLMNMRICTPGIEFKEP